jgi:hypothetical protein
MYFAAKLRLPVQAGGLCRKSSIKFIQPYVSARNFSSGQRSANACSGSKQAKRSKIKS